VNQQYKYERAKKYAKNQRGFYRHLKIFVIINGLLYLLKGGFFNWTLPKGETMESYYFDWVDLHLTIWTLFLVVHAVVVFVWKPKFLNKWEERKIREFIENDKES